MGKLLTHRSVEIQTLGSLVLAQFLVKQVRYTALKVFVVLDCKVAGCVGWAMPTLWVWLGAWDMCKVRGCRLPDDS